MNGVSLPETVVASYASLSGQLQSSLGDLGPSLTELDLEGNSMITGSVIVDVYFTTGGIGKSFVDSALNRDYAVMMGITNFRNVFSFLIKFKPSRRSKDTPF